MTYRAARNSHSRFTRLRGLRHHLRSWGDAREPPLLMLHGWMDVSASFQFVVDAFARERHVVAPDWRGYGLSDGGSSDCYWFPDYLADLDHLLDEVVGDLPVILVGHSMGGNVAMLYAGVRPQRVRAVVNLEGFGLRDGAPERAPSRYAEWLDELKQPPALRGYASRDAVAARLMKTNPRLPADKAGFLAQHWSVEDGQGGYRLAADPAHRIVNPTLYRWAEVAACWQRIAAPVLWVEGGATDAHKWAGDAEEIDRRLALLGKVERATVPDAGHMLHHDQPERVAALIERFIEALPA
jgi:pimeloyl-ACP methyl ester carboxylesterase